MSLNSNIYILMEKITELQNKEKRTKKEEKFLKECLALMEKVDIPEKFLSEPDKKDVMNLNELEFSDLIDCWLSHDKNYSLLGEDIITGVKEVRLVEYEEKTVSLPFYELFSYNRLGRKFQKRGGKISYVDIPFKVSTYNIETLKGKEVIIKGHMQMGKSNLIISAAIKMFGLGLSSVIVLRNSNGDCEQLLNRLVEKLQQFESFLKGTKFENVRIKVSIARNISSKSLLNNGVPTISLLLGNKSQVGKYADIIEANSSLQNKFVVIADEIDYIDTINTKTREQLDRVRKFSHHSYGFTATLFDTLFDRPISLGNILEMETPVDYKGFNIIEFEVLKHHSKYGGKKDSNILVEDPSFKKKYARFNKPELSKRFLVRNTAGITLEDEGEYMPRYTLYRVANTHLGNLRVIDWCVKEHPNTPTMYYHGSGITLSMPKEFSKTNITLANGISSVLGNSKTSWPGDDKLEDSEGFTTHTFENTNPGYLLQWFYENGGVEKFPTISVFAGDLAARSISFGASNHNWCKENKKVWWHLTDMYMLASDSMSNPELLQTFGRLCVRASDNVRLIFHTPRATMEDIRNAYWNHEDIIKRMRSSKYMSKMHSTSVINQIKVAREKLSSRSLTNKSYDVKPIKCSLEEDLADGGMAVEEYKVKLTKKSKKRIVKEEKRIEAEMEADKLVMEAGELTKDELEKMEKLFVKWSRIDCDSKIARLMHGLDPKKDYTKKEITEYNTSNGITSHLHHLMNFKVGKTNGYGKIIKLVNGKYKLYPQLVPLHNKYF